MTATAPVQDSQAEHPSTAQDGTAIVYRLARAIETYFTNGSADEFDAVLAPDLVSHIPGMPADREGIKQALAGFRAAFPDLRVQVDDVIVDGDKVVDRMTWTATHQGPLMGMPATGKRVTVTETHIARVKDGRMVERWGNWDALGMLQQLGAIPSGQ